VKAEAEWNEVVANLPLVGVKGGFADESVRRLDWDWMSSPVRNSGRLSWAIIIRQRKRGGGPHRSVVILLTISP